MPITNQLVSPARSAAFDILRRVEQGAFADELLHSSRVDKLSAADRGLCTEIVMGVLRWRSLLDFALAEHSSHKLEKLDIEVLTALRMGAYQLWKLGRVPVHAAVHDSVELVKRARKRSAAPLVNAVLRKLADAIADQRVSEYLKREAAGGTAYVTGGIDSAEAYAHPAWLVARWVKQYGSRVAGKICYFDQLVPHPAIRLLDPRAASDLQEEGVQLAPGQLLVRARWVIAGDVTKTQAFRDGRVAIQDEGSQLVALLVGSGKRLLDCCAAPGGKTAVLAERNPHATVVAADLHAHRVRLMRRLVRAPNVRMIAADASALPLASEFDRLLADVPCSGTGTLARNPEIKWRLKAADLVDLHRRQVDILEGALQHLAAGGRIVYSTCSLECEENEDVIDEVLASRPGLRLLPAREELERLRSTGELAWSDIDSLTSGLHLRTIPGVHLCDGFFAAILEKTGADQRTAAT